MIYTLMRPLVSVGLRSYFKRISVIGRGKLDSDRTLFVCNHPSALFDPILVAILTKKPLNFLAGAEWFGKGVQKWFFENQFNMIPVYRPWLAQGKDQAKAQVKNEDMFRACYEALKQGKRIIIFPEASSVTVPWIREIKTGAARIKRGADDHAPEYEKVKIIPIGLNYTNPHRFQTGVTVKVGDPIVFDDLLIAYSDEKELVNQMTEMIREKMGDCLLYPENAEAFEFIRDVKKLMTETLKSELGVAEGDLDGEFRIRKAIVYEIEKKLQNSPDKMGDLPSRLRSYIQRFEGLGFRQYNPFQERLLHFIFKLFGLILGLPMFLIGAIANLLPFLGTRFIYKRFFLPKVTVKDAQGQLNSAFAGSLGFGVGLLFYLVWYILLWIFLSGFMPWWFALILLALFGYSGGRFALVYYKWFVQCKKYVRWHWLKASNKEALEDLLSERASLIEELLAKRSN